MWQGGWVECRCHIFGSCATGIAVWHVCWWYWRFWVSRAVISSTLASFAKRRGTLCCKLLIFIVTCASFHEHVTYLLVQLRRHLVTWLDLTLSWIYFYQRLCRLQRVICWEKFSRMLRVIKMRFPDATLWCLDGIAFGQWILQTRRHSVTWLAQLLLLVSRDCSL